MLDTDFYTTTKSIPPSKLIEMLVESGITAESNLESAILANNTLVVGYEARKISDIFKQIQQILQNGKLPIEE
jgi:flagellin-specific chaperone FliS